MIFSEFLNELANGKIDSKFIENLVTSPNAKNNYYFNIGDRWCCVESCLKHNKLALRQLYKFAFNNADEGIAFSIGNLKAQYLPDEDFIDEGSAIVVFSIVGSAWFHFVRIGNQKHIFNKHNSVLLE